MKKELLRVEGLYKKYKVEHGEINVLKNISFVVNENEIVSIMGSSGSGKSTLLNIIGALDSADEGKIFLKGKECEDFFEESYATIYRKEHIGFVFQSFYLLKDFTVKENIALPLILNKTSTKEVEIKTKEMIRLLNLEQWSNQRPHQLSGGQQQRVAIGRALITVPSLLLADEPTGNLDYNTTLDIIHLIKTMKAEFNQSIVIVTHDPQVASYSDRVLFVHGGEIVDEYLCLNNGQDIDNILGKFRNILE